ITLSLLRAGILPNCFSWYVDPFVSKKRFDLMRVPVHKKDGIANGPAFFPIKIRRNSTGAAIAELGPALWVLLFGFFFPVLVLVAMVCTYGSVLVLNYCQVHEAALLPYTEAQDANGAIIKTIPSDWQNMGLGRFCRVQKLPKTDVTYV